MRRHGAIYDRMLWRLQRFCEVHRLQLDTCESVDTAAARFSLEIGRAEGAQLLAALLKAYPPLRGHLVWLTATLHAQSVAAPIHHHPAMPWSVALLIASGLRRLGRPRDAAALALQWRLGLRPGEALLVCPADYRPARTRYEIGALRIGSSRRNKNRRPEFVRVYPADAAAIFLLNRLVACRTRFEFIANSGCTAQFGRWISKACELVHIDPIWTAHCPRAGWATGRILAGQPFPDMQEDGRWKSAASARIYLDAIGGMDALQAPDLQAKWGDMARLEASFYDDFFWLQGPPPPRSSP